MLPVLPFQIPPPCRPVLLPLTVVLFSVMVAPLKLAMPPPSLFVVPPAGVLLPLTVESISERVVPVKAAMPPPLPAAVFPLTVVLVRVTDVAPGPPLQRPPADPDWPAVPRA